MKKLLISITVAGVALAACGGGSGSSRQRNDALPGATGTTLQGTTATTTNDVPTTAPSSGATATTVDPAVTVPVTYPGNGATTTSIPSTSTTDYSGIANVLAKSFDPQKPCAQGGLCKLGDRGPGGGLVFRVDPHGAAWRDPSSKNVVVAHYWEIAPRRWSSGPAGRVGIPFGCVKFPNLRDFGEYDVQLQLAKNCGPTSVAVVAKQVVGSSATDWYLPSAEDLNLARGVITRDAAYDDSERPFEWATASSVDRMSGSARYWTSDTRECGVGTCPRVVVLNGDGAEYSLPCSIGTPRDTSCGSQDIGIVRPVRAFGFTAGFSCSAGGRCAVGDIAPDGGVVFTAPSGPSTDQVIGQLLLDPDESSPVRLTEWCARAPQRADKTTAGVSDKFLNNNSAYLYDDGTPAHYPCGVLNGGTYRFDVGSNLEIGGYNATASSIVVPTSGDLKLLCSSLRNAPVPAGFYSDVWQGSDGKSKPGLATFRNCGLPAGSVKLTPGLKGIWSSTSAGLNKAWAWDFASNSMVQADIRDRSYTVVLIKYSRAKVLVPSVAPLK